MAVEYKNIKAYNLIWSPMGRYPMVDNTIFSTLEEATTFATTNATAVVGSVITVTSDENSDNNGIYYLIGVEGQLPTGLQKSFKDVVIPEVNIPIESITVDGKAVAVNEGVAEIVLTDSYVSKENYIEFTQNEKDKLASLANIKSVDGETIVLGEDGKISAVIPTVEVPVKSIAADDKLLALTETGQLSTTINFNIDSVAREDGKKYIYVTGKDGVEIGKVDTTDFVVDGMLDSVAFEEIDGVKTNNLIFTFNTVSGKESFTVDFSKYVDVYKADEATITLNSETNTFSVKEGVFLTEHQDLSAYAKKEDLATVATSGSYNDLTNKPDLSVYAEKTTVETLTTTVGGHTTTIAEHATAIENLNKLVVGGEGEGLEAILNDVAALKTTVGGETSGLVKDVNDLKDGKQDKLADGSAEKPHLIWVSSTNDEGVTTGAWTPGKIEIPTTPEERLVPETTGVDHPAILVWDGNNVTWSASEVQKELPEYTLEDEGKILVVSKTTNENDEEIAEVAWATAPNNTTITNTKEEEVVISSVISNGEESVEVYSKEAVNNLLSWEQL